MATTTEAKALARQLRTDLGVTGPRSKILCGAYHQLATLVGYGDMDWPHSIDTAMYGISDARTTGRLSGVIEYKLRALSDWQWCSLVADVAAACPVTADVPRYLIERFAAEQEPAQRSH